MPECERGLHKLDGQMVDTNAETNAETKDGVGRTVFWGGCMPSMKGKPGIKECAYCGQLFARFVCVYSGKIAERIDPGEFVSVSIPES